MDMFMEKFEGNWGISKKLFAFEKDSLKIDILNENNGYPPSYFAILNYITIGRSAGEDYISEGYFMCHNLNPDMDNIKNYTYLDLINNNDSFTIKLHANYKIFYDGTFWTARKTTIPIIQEKYNKLHPLLLNCFHNNGDLVTNDYDYWYTFE